MSDLLKKVQEAEYEILKETDRICKENNIKYFLGHGTLIGAVRHHGFIPWDDDIDLLVPYDELEKLIRIFPKQANEKYIITNHRIEKHFPLPWTKIRNKNTLSRPKRYQSMPINWGICIDLFPIYPVSDFKIFRKLEVLTFKIAIKMLMAEFTKYEENHGKLVRILEKIPICIRHLYMNFAIKLFTLHKNNSKYVLLPCKGVKIYERSLFFGEDKSLPFEDGVFPVPSDYHTYLTLNYGDYMTPPKEDEQKGHDLNMGEIEWKL